MAESSILILASYRPLKCFLHIFPVGTMERKRKLDDIDKLQEASIIADPWIMKCVQSVYLMIDQKMAVDRKLPSTDNHTNFLELLPQGSEARNLCERCAKLDLSSIFSNRPRSRRGRPVMELGNLTPM